LGDPSDRFLKEQEQIRKEELREAEFRRKIDEE
jgi:hypothetical protein